MRACPYEYRRCVYEGRLKISLVKNFISAIDDFFTNWIQALKHRLKKFVNHKEDYVEKETPFGHISWEYLVYPMIWLVGWLVGWLVFMAYQPL